MLDEKTSGPDEDLRKVAKAAEGAAKIGKAIANIAKGAATGGLQGAAVEAVKSFKKEIVIISVIVLTLPILFIVMLPQVIFGGVGGTEGANIMNDNSKIVENIATINSEVSGLLASAHDEALAAAEAAAAALEYAEVVDEAGNTILVDANQIICWYCASQNKTVDQISIPHLISMLTPYKPELYYYETHTEERPIEKNVTDEEGNSQTVTEYVTFTIFTVKYAGDDIFPTEVFKLTEKQHKHAVDFAENLSIFLYDDAAAIAMGTHKEIGEIGSSGAGEPFTGEFGNPFPGQTWSISSAFGKRPYPGVGTGTNNHTGMDIPQPNGTVIHAVGDGVVLFVRDSGNRAYGKHLAIDHGNGVVTMYAHCSEILVSAGQTVVKGDPVAKVGNSGWSTGNHLHIEVIINGKPVNPKDYISNG